MRTLVRGFPIQVAPCLFILSTNKGDSWRSGTHLIPDVEPETSRTFVSSKLNGGQAPDVFFIRSLQGKSKGKPISQFVPGKWNNSTCSVGMLLNRPELTWKDDEKYIASIREG